MVGIQDALPAYSTVFAFAVFYVAFHVGVSE
jgi:hypothetical protein